MKLTFFKGFVLMILFFLAIFFRFYNLNWDENFHLHPDERFLTMVGNSMKWPRNFDEYLDQKKSSLNPVNVGYSFFVYGNFPLVLNKYLAIKLNLDNYNDFTILGRAVSATIDVLVMILIFKICLLLFSDKKIIGLFSSLVYGLSVLPIQLSHFFAVDTFLNFFMLASFYYSLKFNFKKKLRYLFFSGIFFSMALASKITAIFVLPLIIIFIFFAKKTVFKKFLYILIFFMMSYFSLRIVNPYYFENKSFFDPKISQNFLSNINQLKLLTIKSLDNWYPPMVQWLSKNSLIHSLVNNSLIGFGLVNSLFFLFGLFILIYKKNINDFLKNWRVFVILGWVLGVFFYQSFQVNPTLRYFIFFYPFFSIFTGLGLFNLLKKIKISYRTLIFYLLILMLIIWPLMFMSIYFNRHSRVVASEWIYKNLPNQSVILGEEWDDPLPLWVENNYGKTFQVELLPVFWMDSQEKWQKMVNLIDKADYYVMSSNRGWGSIPLVPKKYPLMSQFYNQVLSNQCFYEKFSQKNLCFKKIAEFTSYPTLKIPFINIKFTFDDQWTDEGFTVYDHPKVMVFKKI